MKRYLGDGVYVDDWQGGVMLTTEDGIRATNTIYLEPGVIQSLLDYLTWQRRSGGHPQAPPYEPGMRPEDYQPDNG